MSFTVIAGGDVLIHPPLIEQAARDARAAGGQGLDFGPMLAGLRPAVSRADLAICHLETPLAPAAGPFTGFPDFAAPPQIAKALADVGFHSCSTASNHTLDQGEAGVRRTLDALDAAGLRHTGSARSRAEADRPTILEVRGVPVAHLSYSYGFGGRHRPADKPWLANPIGERVFDEARRARRAGAEVVILSMHWGREHRHEPSPRQLARAVELTAGASLDLILGHHAHAVQPFARINGTWVVYGHGNLLARHRIPRGTTEEGLLSWFRFVRADGSWRVRRLGFIPTLIDLTGPVRAVALPAALADPGLPPEHRSRYERAYHRTRTVALRGVADPPGPTGRRIALPVATDTDPEREKDALY
ncbi:CapA family protein [Streptomyces sp. NPDC048595]|uniref:CapA family protein n=1 Tax=Streptomyces sp. NPDC048595 TaxID=3365576 RepID=UPI003713E799